LQAGRSANGVGRVPPAAPVVAKREARACREGNPWSAWASPFCGADRVLPRRERTVLRTSLSVQWVWTAVECAFRQEARPRRARGPRSARRLSPRGQDAEEQRGERGEAREGAADGEWNGGACPRVKRGGEARRRHDHELHDERCPVRARSVGPDGEDVPDADRDQHHERDPGDDVEAPRHSPGRVGRDPAQPEGRDRRASTDRPPTRWRRDWGPC
jgi:hypothetical protein